MRKFEFRIVAVLVVSLATWSSSANAAVLGMVDDFEDGTVLNWLGHFSSITNIPTGGPANAGDNYLQLVSSGTFGGGSRMVMFNPTQWAGDYGAAGISAISADVNNLGNENLDLRFAFSNGSTWYASTNSFPLSSGSGWQSVNFDLQDVTLLQGADDIATTLSNVSTVRLLSSPNLPSMGSAGPKGDLIAGELGLDNIRAIPEPSSLLLVALGFAGFEMCRRRRSCQIV